jgi:NitT/TauT family transport system substrate-binding protein
MPIRVMENFRAVFYAPFYAAHALGFYEREGVEVELLTSNTPGDAVPLLVDGAIDLTWGGPMRVMKARDLDPESTLVGFCEVVSRDPFFLIGRSGSAPFHLSDLAHRRFACVSEVPTPWMCLQQDLRDQAIDPERVDRIADRTMADNYAALRAGTLDIMQAFEPFASLAENDAAGEILYAASTRGPTVYTTFIATEDGIARHRDAFVAMTRAISRMQAWLAGRGAEGLAKATASFFQDVPFEILLRAMRRYHEVGVWAASPAMSADGFVRLGRSLHSGGFLSRMPVYHECVAQGLDGAPPA